VGRTKKDLHEAWRGDTDDRCGRGANSAATISVSATGKKPVRAKRERGMSLTTFARHERLRARLATVLDLSGAAERAAAPVVDLLVRLALAKAFFAPGMFPGVGAADLPAAWPMIIVQVIGPVRMAVGLLVRPVALLMLALTLRAQFSGAAQDEHLFWAALFGWYVVHGPASLSLDRLLSNGMRHSPLPLAAVAIAVGDWVNRATGSLYVLAIRLWLAAALAAPVRSHPMLPVMQDGMLPSWLLILAAVSLVLGLGTPVAAVLLFVAGSGMAMAGSSHGMTIYEPLLLALLGVSGAGRYSLDNLIGCWARRATRAHPDMPHVVIVGAGFGGMACAAGLRHEPVRVTLIDRENYHLFQPLLYQVATAALSPADITTPVRAAFRDNARMRVLRGTVTAVDVAARRVVADGRAIAYDTLVLATGATHGYFGREEWATYAPGLKSVADATSIRSRILDAFEKAEATEDPGLQRKLLTFLICGAGPTGVELAGAIAELAHNGMAKDFRNFDPASARILLVQAGPRVLPQFDERLSAFARASLEALGVEVCIDSRVELIDEDGVVVNGERVEAGTVLWAAGVVASPASAWLGAEADRAGRIKVGPDLSVPGFSDIFAIGDTALSLAWDGQPVPGLAPAAKQGGAYVASVLRARLRGRKPPAPFRYRHQGSLATIGRKSAVADFGRVKVTGAAAWWLWGAVHVFFLAGLRNRLSVMLGWVWSYFTFDVGARLITEAGETSPRRGD
jgi:putative oxidoreductase